LIYLVKREGPSHVERIDRILCSVGWEVAHPHCLMRCLSSAASDHAPLLVDCTPRSPGPRRFHFERFWPTLEGFGQTVADAWNAAPPEADPFRRLFVRLKRTARRLQSWSSRSIGHVATQLCTSRELIACLDAAQDFRQLSPAESWLRKDHSLTVSDNNLQNTRGQDIAPTERSGPVHDGPNMCSILSGRSLVEWEPGRLSHGNGCTK
jgi:hypothetical protein